MNALVPIVVILGPILIGACLIGFVVWIVARTSRGSRESARMTDQETKLLNDLILSMNKMERRVENLETILHAGIHSERRE